MDDPSATAPRSPASGLGSAPAPGLGPAGRRRRHLLEQGFTDRQLAGEARLGVTQRLHHGLYLPLPTVGTRDDVARLPPQPQPSPEWATLQALTSMGGHVVSHETAAIIHGLSSSAPTPPFHLTSPRAAGQMRRPGVVIGHRSALPPDQIMEIAGVPVTSPARTWADCAVGLSLIDALVMADQAIRRPWPRWEGRSEPLATRADLERALRSKGRTAGVSRARAALQLARIGADSPQETRLRYALHRAGLPEPEVNVPVRDETGRIRFRPDLGFRQYRVSVQYDGEPHSDPHRVRKDVRRRENTEAELWWEVSITADHMVAEAAEAVEKVTRVLCARGWPG